MAPPNPNGDGDLQTILLADFAAMRSEITTYISLQGQFLSMTVVLASICVAAAIGGSTNYLKPYASFAAIPFVILGLLYADSSARVMRTARYINCGLWPKLMDMTGESYPGWEEYIRHPHPGKGMTRSLEYARWVLFIFPASYLTGVGLRTPNYWPPALDLVLIILCVYVLLYVEMRLSRKVVEP